MPIPVFVIAAAALAGAAGAGAGIQGGMKIAKAKGREKDARRIHQENTASFERDASLCNQEMDSLGILELQVLESFQEFSDIVGRIQNAPKFDEVDVSAADLPQFDSDEFRNLSVGAKSLLGGLGGAAAGVAGGVAASGATTAVVAAFGTASTGTAISTLSGAAATKAVLAALGGGSLAMGGGGMALGTVVLGAASAGAALLVGGVIVNVVGGKLDAQAIEFEGEVLKEQESVERACALFRDIAQTAAEYKSAIIEIQSLYVQHLGKIAYIVIDQQKTDWASFTEDEKMAFENTVLLVGALYRMCKTNLVVDVDGDGVTDKVNEVETRGLIAKAREIACQIKA